MTDTAELRKLAEAINARDWHAFEGNVFFGDGGIRVHEDCQPNERAAYIAAANPSAILALLDHLEAPADRVEKLEAALRFYADTNSWRTSTVYACGHSEAPKACCDGGDIARAALLTEGAQS